MEGRLEREIEQLRARLRCGDPAALEEFAEHFHEPLRRIVRRCLRIPSRRADQSQLEAAVSRLARAMLSGQKLPVLACETEFIDEVPTRLLSREPRSIRAAHFSDQESAGERPARQRDRRRNAGATYFS
jgi:hypothetical protein